MKNTICLTTVASRNLTTLFASCCMLHPHIQVLNHCPSINDSEETNFLTDFSEDKLDNFVTRVKYINENSINVPGDGGVIVTDHAFKGYLKKAYHDRYNTIVKDDIQSIIWKDSPRNTKILQSIDLDKLLARTDKLRFLLIVRNPMDCALSSSSPGYNVRYRKPSKEEILKELFERYEWSFNMEKKYPQFFMHFFQDEVDDDLLDRLQNFLLIDGDEMWRRDFKKSWRLKKSYDHSKEYRGLFKSLINKYDFLNRKKFERFLR